MVRIAYTKFFPTPRFLITPSVGLDISDRSVKFAELVRSGKNLQLGKFGEKKISSGVIDSGKINNPKKLIKVLSYIQRWHKLDFVRVSLPEQQIYSFKIQLPEIKGESVRAALELQLEKHIPIPAREAVFDYEVVGKNKNGHDFQVAATPRSVIESYLSVLKASSLTPISFEIESQSVARSVVPKDSPDTYMIVDFGHTRTGISIVSNEIVRFTSTVEIGGSMLTKVVAKEFKLDIKEAEELKEAYGLKRNGERKELFSVLLNTISVLRDEINKNYIYWHTHKDEDGKKREKIQKILLCGRNSNLIGFVEYLTTSLKVKVELANAWVNVNNFDNYIPEISFDESLGHVTSIGLALGGFKHD